MAIRWGVKERDARLQPTKAAVDAAKALGLSVDELIQRATASAPYTSAAANRRSRDLCFYIEAGTIYGVWRIAANENGPRRDQRPRRDQPQNRYNTKLTITCPVCVDEGGVCLECGGTRTITRTQAEIDQLMAEICAPSY